MIPRTHHLDDDTGTAGVETADPDVLLGVLAHELRTPITTIYAGSAVLARDDALLPAMRRELASDVQAEAARLYRAVEDLLVLTRLEHDALKVAREPVALMRAADAAVQLEAPRWPNLRIELRLDGSPPPVAADTTALGHALRNLLSNIAWRARGITELEIAVASSGDDVACRLIDRTGSLTPDDLPGLFALPALDPRPGMTSPGIAMYVAARLIGAMGGSVWAQPLDDGAVEIGFSLPRYAPAA